MSDEYKSDYKPIVESFMRRNYLFGLEFKEGYVFGRTIGYRNCNYKPLPVIDGNGSVVDIAPDSHQAELRIRDPANTTTAQYPLWLDTVLSPTLPWFFHGAIGIKPANIRAYFHYPETLAIPGKFPALNPTKPSSKPDHSYLDSLLSPYEQPSDFLELIIPPKTHIGIEYYNMETESGWTCQPVLNLRFRLYRFQVLAPQKFPQLISSIASRSVRADLLVCGIDDNPIEYASELRETWKAVPLTLDEAIALGKR